MKSKTSLWLIIVITLVALLVDFPNPPSLKIFGKTFSLKYPLKLGLDLQGGTQLVLQTQMDKINPQDRDSALSSAREVIERRVNLYGVSEAVVQSSKLGEERRILVELPGLKNASSAAELVGKTAQLEFREVSKNSSPSGILTYENTLGTGLTGKDLTKSQVVFGGGRNQAGPQVELIFTPEGAKKFAEITKRNVGKPLAIFLDQVSVSAPTVQQEIVGGSAVITGRYSIDQAKNLAIQLNAGALPVPIKIIEQRSVGPSLGEQSVHRSLVAGAIGLSVVIIYMAAFYGLWGIMADLALIIYALLVLAIFKSGFFIPQLQVTLTLAGIAGFILSIGMAVDANILIFERMKEEIRWGKTKSLALELGFKRAWTSIWASNVSSLITAAILYTLGTSIVKGFALTLAIGVLVSMFTAVVVTRTFLRMIVS